MSKETKISVHSLWKSGALDFVQQNGIRNIETTIKYCKIYDEYLKFRTRGMNYTTAVELTAEKLCVTDSLVKKAIAEVI